MIQYKVVHNVVIPPKGGRALSNSTYPWALLRKGTKKGTGSFFFVPKGTGKIDVLQSKLAAAAGQQREVKGLKVTTRRMTYGFGKAKALGVGVWRVA